MAQGLNYLPTPYVSRVMIEAATNTTSFQANWVDLYTDKTTPESDNQKSKKLKTSFDLSFKCLYPSLWNENGDLQLTERKEIEDTIKTLGIQTIRITDQSVLRAFLDATDKIGHLTANSDTIVIGVPLPPSSLSISTNSFNLVDYLYSHSGKNTISIPFYTSDIYEYDTSMSTGANPNFLAYVFIPLKNGAFSYGNVFTSEILFKKGQMANRTTYFVIGDKYKKGGKTYNLLENNATTKEVKSLYGSPGQLWCGAAYRQGANFMAGGAPEPEIPCPYLVLSSAPNDKIIDLRSAQATTTAFAHKSSKYENSLSLITAPTFTNDQAWKTLDNFNKRKAILTELDYSVRTFTSGDDYSIPANSPPKDKLCLFFGIDKGRVLKNSTALPALLDRLVMLDATFLTQLANQITITNFEIKRMDLTTKETKTLLIGNNGIYFDDAAAAEPTKIPPIKAKGYKLRRLGTATAPAKIKINSNSDTIDFYEFRDGEIEPSTYNNHTFKYSIKISFRDPIWNYLNTKLSTVRTILKDLDELLLKTSLKTYDSALNKYVPVFSQYSNKMNPSFVQQAMANNMKAGALLTFPLVTTGLYEGVPQSLANAVSPTAATATYLGNIIHAIGGDMSALRSIGDPDVAENWNVKKRYVGIATLGSYLIASTKLATTTPVLLEKARSILGLLEDKLSKVLSIYSREVRNKSSAPAANEYTDYLKNQGNVSHAGMVNEIQVEETFEKEINLEKTKNYFDWLRNMGPTALPSYNLKVIKSGDYVNAIQNAFNYLLSPSKPVNTLTNNYQFFPPYTMNLTAVRDRQLGNQPALIHNQPLCGRKTFNLFNFKGFKEVGFDYTALPAQWQDDYEEKFYQVMREKLFGRSTDTRKNVSMVEVLSYFGIRGPTKFSNDQIIAAAALISGAQKAAVSLIASSLDFGRSADSGDVKDERDSDGNPTGKFTTNTGGVSEKDTGPGGHFEWGGKTAKIWDINAAKKIINLIFSDNTKKGNYRNLNLFHSNTSFMKTALLGTSWKAGTMEQDYEYKMDMEGNMVGVPVWKESGAHIYDTKSPPAMNLLTGIANTSTSLSAAASSFVHNQIFQSNGTLRLENYHLYILFLCLFGKVQYLHGFTQGAQSTQLTPTSYYYRAQVKSYIWRDLTKTIIDGLGSNDLLYCRIRLYDEGNLIDDEYIQLFRKYFTKDQHFYMVAGETAAVIAPENINPTLTMQTPNLTTADTTPGPTPGVSTPGLPGPGLPGGPPAGFAGPGGPGSPPPAGGYTPEF